MPPIIPILVLGNLKFTSHRKKLPTGWKEPRGKDRVLFYKALKPEQRICTPKLEPCWFFPASSVSPAVDACDQQGLFYKDMHDTMCEAVVFSHFMWKLQAKFSNIQIQGPVAIGNSGCLTGPELEKCIKFFPGCSRWQGSKAKYRDAIAAGVSKCFKEWQDAVTVPGLPWYPMFAAVPAPMMPPTPNVPTPLIACVSSKADKITASESMRSAIGDELDADLKRMDDEKHYDALFDAIGTTLSVAFTMWLSMQQAALVLGQGQNPAYAPPYVPVGPIVNGSVVSVPGHCIT